MVDFRDNAVQYAKSHAEQNLSTLVEFLKIPSVSTDPEHIEDMSTAANWIAGRLKG